MELIIDHVCGTEPTDEPWDLMQFSGCLLYPVAAKKKEKKICLAVTTAGWTRPRKERWCPWKKADLSHLQTLSLGSIRQLMSAWCTPKDKEMQEGSNSAHFCWVTALLR
ncbi:uncharacterized protein LOC118542308 [Halichoerus grypus]